MEPALYDTSWHMYRIPKLSASLLKLLAPGQAHQASSKIDEKLSQHGETLRDYLNKERPRYEREEEKAHLGDLKACTWKRFKGLSQDDNHTNTNKKRKRGDDDEEELQSTGLLISLLYEKKVDRFVIYATSSSVSSKRSRSRSRSNSTAQNRPATSPEQNAVLLSRLPPATLKAVINYLSEKFSIDDIHLCTISSSFIQSSLENYLRATYGKILSTSYEQEFGKQIFKSFVGNMKVTIAFSPPVAPKLKSSELTIPPPTTLNFCQITHAKAPGQSSTKLEPFLETLGTCVAARTGLLLPIHQQQQQQYRLQRETPDVPGIPEYKPVMQVSKISMRSYGISSDGRLKFESRVLDVLEREGDANFISLANQNLLHALVDHVHTAATESGDGDEVGNNNGDKPLQKNDAVPAAAQEAQSSQDSNTPSWLIR